MRLPTSNLLLALCFCWGAAPAGCGGDDDAGGGDADGDSDSDSDADGDGDGDSDGDADFGTCGKSCIGPADCVPADADATKDENNWSCEASHCEFLGCQGTGECQELFPGMPSIACDTGVEPHRCTLPCGTPADCEVAGSPLYGADNWSCDASLCVYEGCNANEECGEAHPDAETGCALYMEIPVCMPSCAAPIDCTNEAVTAALFDEAHWLCTGGVCEHKGCASDQECQDSAVYGPQFTCVF